MNEEFGNLILEYLREILADLASTREQLAEIKTRIGSIEQRLKSSDS